MTEERGVVEYTARDGQQIKLTADIVKKLLVRGRPEFVTMPELYYFMGLCKSRGLNPFINDCYLIKYTQNDPAAVITSVDFFRKRARAQQDCVGWKNGISLLNARGELEHRKGTILLEGEKLVGGWFEAKPVGWDEPMFWTVNLKGYIKRTKEGNVTQFWSEDKQPGQIAKVAESQGLRKLWPDQFQGLYVDAEAQEYAAEELERIIGEPAAPVTTEAKQEAAANGKREAPRDKTLDERFWEIIPKQYDKTLVMEFLELAAKNNKVEPKDAMANAILNPESFIKFLATWYKKIKPKAKEPEIIPPEEPAFVGPPEPPPKQEKPEQYLNCPDGGLIAMVDCADCPKKPCEAWE